LGVYRAKSQKNDLKLDLKKGLEEWSHPILFDMEKGLIGWMEIFRLQILFIINLMKIEIIKRNHN